MKNSEYLKVIYEKILDLEAKQDNKKLAKKIFKALYLFIAHAVVWIFIVYYTIMENGDNSVEANLMGICTTIFLACHVIGMLVYHEYKVKL